ncbi:MAG: TAXI family TRAP transporter solute-binding subunit, partial [Natronospirillum sp.]
GSGTEVNAVSLLEANGITYDDFSPQRLNFNETADALRDGDIDAGFWSVGPPASSIMSLANSRDIQVMNLSDEEVANAMAEEPVFAPYDMPVGTYEGVDEVVKTIGIPNVLVVNSAMSDDLAYNITRIMFEHVSELRAVHPAAYSTTPNFSVGATPIPLHPGSARYYEEIGFSLPARLQP